MRGRLIQGNAILLRRRCGVGSTADGRAYETGTAPDGSPILRSRQSGVYWQANWAALVTMAIEDGIDDPQGGGGDVA
jgi:hypothetical protein